MRESRPCSRAGLSSDSRNPNFYSTRPSTQVLRDLSMEDSGDESDGVYDQFDLGDFTKEEIKIYESMVGPGERLRDAAPPEKSLAEMLETSYQTSLTSSVRFTKANASIRVLPEELYELVRAGISNAIERAISIDLIPGYGRSAESLEKVFLDEISAPTPQISRFIRNHRLIWSFSAPKGWSRREALEMSGYKSGSKRSAQRRYEQDVYDFSRNLGLPMDGAEKWVLKARDFWCEKGFDSTDTEESDDVSSWDEMPDQSSRASSSEMFRLPLVPIEHSDEAPRDTSSGGLQANRSLESGGTSVFGVSQALTSEGESTFRSKDKIEDTVQPMTRNQFTGARQLQQHQFQNLEGSDHRSEGKVNMPATLRPPIPSDRSLVVDVIGHVDDSRSTEAVVNGHGEKTAKSAVKRAVKNSRKAKGEADKGATIRSRAGKHEHIGNSEEQVKMASNSEQLSQSEQLEVKDEPQLQKGKRRKRKRDHDLLPQSAVLLGESHKHIESRVDGEAQDVNSRRGKRKIRGPRQSPFFQRNNGPKAKNKDAGMEAQQHMGFQPPMIQLPPADLPSTPMKKGISMILTSPPSNDSSPLSSLRSTPSLPSFGNKEVESDNKRIRQLSHSCARSKLVASTQKILDGLTGLPTPSSSPISLRELNKRLLEGTIYQDGIVLARPRAPATLVAPKKKKKRSMTVSRFFIKSPCKKPKRSDKVSCVPFPPLHATSFGLVQERLSHDPFRLLIAVIFLNKTRGTVALPVFYQLMERYPTPADLAAAKHEDVVKIIQHLGLQNQRAKKCINLAKAWLERPPERGKRYRVLHYPKKDDGKDVRPGDIVDEKDTRVAWEIGQLPGIGVYAIDSWRIFCRDELRGLPTGLPKELTPEAKEEELQKEWTRVVAGDKELRAYLRWRWLRNGWEWDPVTGERKKADEGELAKADQGGIIYEGDGGDVVVGNAKGGEPEVVKAELGTGEDDTKDGGKPDDVIIDTKTEDAPQNEGGEAESITAGPQHSHDRGIE